MGSRSKQEVGARTTIDWEFIEGNTYEVGAVPTRIATNTLPDSCSTMAMRYSGTRARNNEMDIHASKSTYCEKSLQALGQRPRSLTPPLRQSCPRTNVGYRRHVPVPSAGHGCHREIPGKRDTRAHAINQRPASTMTVHGVEPRPCKPAPFRSQQTTCWYNYILTARYWGRATHTESRYRFHSVSSSAQLLAWLGLGQYLESQLNSLRSRERMAEKCLQHRGSEAQVI